jgi:hypothetical protein
MESAFRPPEAAVENVNGPSIVKVVVGEAVRGHRAGTTRIGLRRLG